MDNHYNDPIPYIEEEDAYLPSQEWDRPQIEMGKIGWENESDYYEKGSAQDDGKLLIRVQLFRGRNHTRAIKQGTAQGNQLLCVMNGLYGHRIPPKGTVCYVALPYGFDTAMGTPVIIATVEKNPTLQFNGTADGADGNGRMVIGDGTQHIIIRGKSVTLTGPDNCVLMVGTSRGGGSPCAMMQDNNGAGVIVQGGVAGVMCGNGASLIQVKSTGLDIVTNGGNIQMMSSNDIRQYGKQIFVMGGGVFLGKAPTATNAAAVYPLVSGVPAPSTSVFISI